jgi:hypothetical protein
VAPVRKIGFVLRDLGPSQLAYALIRELNAASGCDPYVFWEEPRRPCVTPRFACMPVVDAWSFDGPLVATTLSTANKVRAIPAASPKLFYVWDLEWVRPQRKHWLQFQPVYGDPALTLVARDESHRDAIESAWNRKVLHVTGSPNLEKFLCWTY